jgi:hypothetical protein
MSKYDPLRMHLQSRLGTKVVMRFDEIGALVDTLPDSAYRHRPWWGNHASHVQAMAWLAAGFTVGGVDLDEQVVSFARGQGASAAQPATTIGGQASGSHQAGQHNGERSSDDEAGPGHCARPLVIVPCGKAKQHVAAPAGELYTGAFHRACLRYARILTVPERILILSGKYGLLELDAVIEPYEERIKPSMSVIVRQQAVERRLLGAAVVALGGADYRAVCRAVWPACAIPMAGLGGMGKMLAWLSQQVRCAT